MIDTIPLSFKVTGTTITLPFCAICSVTDKEFGGDLIIEYKPRQKALEYVNAEEVVNKIATQKITAEDLIHQVYQEVNTSIDPEYLKVLVDVKYSKAHKPVKVWIESN